ncbi:MAG: hypothetical protein MR029_07660, partial [Clostridium sp.]|nr:hypothetical protein [Clostridium sp.]
SDDYIAPWMYEFLYSLFYDDIDIVECGFYTVYDDNAQFDDLADPFEIEEFTAEKAVMENIRDQIFRQLIWNKMYRRRTIGDIRFPIGSKIDDEFWTYQVLGNARKLLHTNKRLYAYRQQKNSIMHSLNSQERIQAVEAKIQRHKYICIKLPELKGESLYNLWFTCLYQGQLALKSSNVYEKKSIVIFLKKTLRTYRIDLAELKEISITHKLWIVLEKIWFVGACKLRNLLKCGI